MVCREPRWPKPDTSSEGLWHCAYSATVLCCSQNMACLYLDAMRVAGWGAMLGWVNLDREQVREFATILMPGIAALGLTVLLLIAS